MAFPSRAAMASPIALLAFAPALVLAQETTVEARDYTLSVETVVEGLYHPWALAFISDQQFLVTERNAGTLRVGHVDGTLSEPIWEAEDLFRYDGETGRSQAGLFDLQLHPDFEENGQVYVSYARETEQGAAVVVVRGTLTGSGDDLAFTDVEDVFVMKEEDQDSSGVHFGGRMAIDPADGAVFLSIGERRNISRAQDAGDQAGSVLRMTADGDPHPDNVAFEDADGEEQETDPYLFTMGNRNIQALAIHPTTNELWGADHGPLGGDEIQLLMAGNNYGWPYITGGRDYSGAPMGVGLAMEGMISPVYVFEDTVAPSGATFVPLEAAFDAWAGDLLIGGLVTEGVVRVRLEGGEVVDQEDIEIGQRVRDVRIGPDGDLWLVTDHEDGAVLRVSVQN